MLGIIGLVFVSMIIGGLELPSLLKKKNKKDIVVFLLLLSMGFGLGCLTVLDVNVPPFLKPLDLLYRPISDFVFSLFK